ncbi:unnamed protein product [Caenorhabditis auriculariae]|uniref:Uncharacterized protein n=1 Tax=Caenorhabditis auriculariae TaxID=2777116 RepID=A0A8S1GWY1_9PELO|nr:unnamed protein product [Caenorhabditis auriculariae]
MAAVLAVLFLLALFYYIYNFPRSSTSNETTTSPVITMKTGNSFTSINGAGESLVTPRSISYGTEVTGVSLATAFSARSGNSQISSYASSLVSVRSSPFEHDVSTSDDNTEVDVSM